MGFRLASIVLDGEAGHRCFYRSCYKQELEAEILGAGSTTHGALQFLQLSSDWEDLLSRGFSLNEPNVAPPGRGLPEAPHATAIVAVLIPLYSRASSHTPTPIGLLNNKKSVRQSVSTYVLSESLLDHMECLGYSHAILTIPELHAMLKLAENGIPKKTPAVLAIRQGQIQKPKSQAQGNGKQRGKGKSKLAYDPKHKIPPPTKKKHPAKDTELHLAHPGLRGYWKLNKGALDMYVGNGHSVAVEAIGSFELILPSGMILVLDNCYFSLSITRGIVSLSRLWDKCFRHEFMDNGVISVSKDNICYFNAFPRDGIFEIDMHNHISNERSIYTCSNKKTKHNLDSTFLWHCRPGHINKKSIEKLQHDGLLESINDESFDVCVSCISGKMARKPFTHASERADDLLGIIHSDVCGSFRTTSREDRGGEYLSQEFLDHLRSHGIILQLTLPYTPQHNGVSKRRNQTLLDMVGSMMSLTTLTMSFWGYALESAARILNMVPTKKVNKTPYEMWQGKVPNMSYLKVWGCEALVKRDTPNKLESKSIKCIFVGYLKETMGYYFYNPLENKNFVARYAEFFETNLIKEEASGSTVDFDEIQKPQTDVIPARRSARISQAPERYGFYIDAEEHELGDHCEPPNYQAALSDPEFEKWLEAMNAEMQSMKDN
ncbi:retrotransposon protein, putative, ty1-copia subclass [Tanacetum coccineum]